jgi:raffinose/stachyose/melibiose transport system substrate-binding protein
MQIKKEKQNNCDAEAFQLYIVNVLDVEYTNVDLINTSAFQGKNTMLAPRFLILNTAVSDLTMDALIQIVGGKDRDDVLADFSKQIKQKLAG